MGSKPRKNDLPCKNLRQVKGEYVEGVPADEPAAQPPPETPALDSAESAAGRLHRIRTIRRQQGISLRCAARRMHLPVERAKALEEETADMLLSTLYAWQRALEVPVGDLLVDRDGPLSEPVLKRARLVKLMKTAAAIQAVADTEPIARLAKMLTDQLIEIMPELKDVSPWHSVGQRRTLDEVGRIAEQPFPEQIFRDSVVHG